MTRLKDEEYALYGEKVTVESYAWQLAQLSEQRVPLTKERVWEAARFPLPEHLRYRTDRYGRDVRTAVSPLIRTVVKHTVERTDASVWQLSRRWEEDMAEVAPSLGVPEHMMAWTLPRLLRTVVLAPVLPYLRGTAPIGEHDRRRRELIRFTVVGVLAPMIIEARFPKEAALWRGVGFQSWDEASSMIRESCQRMRRECAEVKYVPGESAGGFAARVSGGLETTFAYSESALFSHSVARMLPGMAAEACFLLHSIEPWWVVRELLFRMACLGDRCRLHPDCAEHAELGKACFDATVRPWFTNSSGSGAVRWDEGFRGWEGTNAVLNGTAPPP